MGIDAHMFAKNAKKCCDFDRLYNISDVWDLKDDAEQEEGIYLYESIQVGYSTFKGGLTKAQVLRLIELNRKAGVEDPESTRNNTWYFDQLEKFVNFVGEDTYFVENDHTDGYCDLLKQYDSIIV
jgi:hypothetical protein